MINVKVEHLNKVASVNELVCKFIFSTLLLIGWLIERDTIREGHNLTRKGKHNEFLGQIGFFMHLILYYVGLIPIFLV